MKYLIAAVLLCVASPAGATPHPNPFSYPYSTLAKDALEVEQYVDLVPVRVEREKADGTIEGVTSLRSVLQTEIEYGLTDRWEVGFYFAFRQGASATTPFLRFDGVKQRARYRFCERDHLPVDLGIYLELAEFHDEIEFEEKVIVAKRLGDLELTANLWIEQEWYFQTNDTKYIYNPTLAASYQLSPRMIVGAEYWTRGRFDDPSATESASGDAPTKGRHYAGPTFLYQRQKASFALGVYARLDGLGDSAVVNDPYGKLWVRAIVSLDL